MSGAVHQPNPIARRPRKAARQPLLSSCAIAAAMVAAGQGAPVQAQSYIATVGATTNASVSTGPNTTTVTVSGSTAIVNWTATNAPGTDGVVAFQNAGTNAFFESTGGNYQVLNRVTTAGGNPVSFAGNTTSVIGSIDGGPIGGTVWFYSPGGIVLGSTARFDVGSLGLSTLDISDADFLDGDGTISFAATPDSRSLVNILPGAQIDASVNEGSYVAIVSPRISQGGAVTVNGSAAYVAAEAADITINGGLFNIAVQAGSNVDAGGETTLSHTGTTTGPGPLSGTDSQAIYMVAVPKNDAVTMLVTGTLGYGAASSASIENGSIILSAGFGVSSFTTGNGEVSVSTGTPPTAQNASINITDGGNFTSRVTGYAVTDALATGSLNFDSAFELRAGRNASLTADAGETVQIGGSVRMLTFNRNAAGASVAGQAAFRALNGGTITVLGGATADASSIGGGLAGSALFEATNGSTLDFRRESFVFANGTGVTSGAAGQGGTASLNLTNATYLSGEQLQVTADGTGGGGSIGGNGTGGTASITLVDSTLSITPTVSPAGIRVSASGTGARGTTGGTGTGGTATISADDSALLVGSVSDLQALDIIAEGTGGQGTNGGAGGAGQGGTASLAIFDSAPDATPATIRAGSIGISTSGTGAGIEFGYGSTAGGTGGGGTGGTSSLSFSGGTLTAQNISILALGTGASGHSAESGPDGGAGGQGVGGTATFTVDGGALSVANFIGVSATGEGGDGGQAFEFGYGASGDGGDGGDGDGGTASLVQNGGTVTAAFINVTASGFGGEGGSSSSALGGAGGDGNGGDALASITGGGLTLSGSLGLNADAEGGQGASGTGSATGPGGAALGGLAELTLSGGSVSLDTLRINAGADGSDAFASASTGDARGGTARAILSDTGALTVLSNATFGAAISIDASAEFDNVEGASDGDAFGGTASFLVENGGTLTYSGSNANPLAITADAEASTGFLAGTGANATGGTAIFTVNDATVNLPGQVAISADAFGGDGANGGSAGSGTGGTASLAANGGSVTLGTLSLSAIGSGGITDEGGNGGMGRGGIVSILSGGGLLSPVAAGEISLSSITLDASGNGGDAADASGYGFGGGGGDGAAAIGGTATFEALNGSITVTGSADLFANADGGSASNGGDSGAATGGTASVISGGDENGSGLIDIAALSASANAEGGSSSETGYGSPPAIGGDGGSAIGGAVTIGTQGGALNLASVSLSAQGDGDSGGSGTTTGGNGGNGTGGSVTIAARDSALDLSSTAIFIDVLADGGNGGSGFGSGAAGGNGGTAVGGSIILATSGENGAFTLDPGDIIVNNSAGGGFGGDGGSGTTGGRGGNGGNATGGLVQITTALGELTFAGVEGTGPSISVSASGGDGGLGGDGSNVGDTGGDGGNGGDGTGGTISVEVNGGSANFGVTELFAQGNGGFAGNGGTGAGNPGAIPPIPATPASQGIDGTGRGGTVSIVVNDDADTGAAGSANFSDTEINVAGFFNDGFNDIGGRIEIYDNGTAPGGGIEFASLDAISTGFSPTSDQAIDFFSADRRINVIGDATVDAGGPAYFRATGGGGLDVGSALSINSGFFVSVEHDSQTETPADTISAGSIVARSSSDFSAFADSRITSTGDVDIRSDFGSIDLNFVGTPGSLILRSANELGLGGANVGGFIDAESVGSVTRFDNITAVGDIEVDAGYNLALPDDDNVPLNFTSNVTAGNITSTGGEIDIEATGTVTGGDLSAGHELSITALTGSITLDSAAAGTLAVPPSPDNNRSIGLLAATDVTINGSATAAADIGLGAVTGSISAGSLDAGASVALLAADAVDVGPVDASFFFYVGNSSGIPAGVDPGELDIFSFPFPPVRTGGDVSIGGPVNAGPILIASGGATSFTDMASTSSVRIDSAGPISGNSIDALSNIEILGDNAVEIGSLSAGETGYGFGANIFVDADGDIAIGTATAVGNIDILGGANADIGAATAFAFESGYGIGGGNLFVSAGSILLESAASDGDIRLTTTPSGNAFLAAPVAGRTIDTGLLVAGGDINLDGLDDISVADATAGGTLQIIGTDAITLEGAGRATGNILLSATESITVGSLVGGQDVELVTDLRGGDTSLTKPRSITIESAEAGDDLLLAAFGAVNAGTLKTNGTGLDGTPGLRNQFPQGYPDAPGSVVFVIGEKGATIGSIEAAGDVGVTNVAEVRNGVQISDGSGGITIDAIVAGGRVGLTAPLSAIAVGAIDAGGTVGLTSQQAGVAVLGDISAGGAVTASGTTIELNALGDLNIANAVAVDDLTIRARGDLVVNNAYATAADGTMELVGGFPFDSEGAGYLLDGDLTVTGTVSAGSYVHLDGGGDVTITGNGRVRSDGDIDIRSGDDIFLQAGAIVGLGASLPAQPNVQVPDRVGGPADTVRMHAGLLRFGTANLPANGASSINIDGTVRGLTIDLASEAIDIGSAASIGAEETELLSFTNSGTARSFIGGSGAATGYALSNAEFSRNQAAVITIFGPSTGSSTGGLADVVIQGLDILGSQAPTSSTSRPNLVGGSAELFIRSGGTMRVEGNVALTQAGANDTLFLSANRRIDVITPSGSIAVTGAQNALVGRIGMSADVVFVGSDAAAQAIAALGTTDEIDERLGTADGDLRPEGFLQAGSLEFSIENALYIQNSGGPGLGSTARAGFTAGTGGVSIDTGESSNARIIINGRQSDGNGGFIGGVDLIPLLTINGTHNPTGGFDLRSTANGCLIVGQTCRFDMEVEPVPPVQDVIEEIVDTPENEENQDGTAVVQVLNLPMIQLVDTAGLSFEPLIDEPVTGAGNDDFWIGDEEEPEEDGQ